MTDIRDRPFGSGLQDFFANLNVANGARCLTAVAALLCVLVTLEPFPDLSRADVTGMASGRLASTYVCFGALAAIAIFLSASENAPSLKTLGTPLNLCFVGWMVLNIALSESPEVS